VSQADVDVVEQFLKAFAAQDIETFFSLCSPDIVVDEGAGLPYAGRYEGPAGLQDLVGKMMAAYEMTLDSFQVSDGGDCAIARLDLSFTARASGRSTKMPAMEIYKTSGGKVTDIDVYYKSTTAIAEL
jgi:ketosteroid isomerase-like protein